jgi:pimeloyl-ACP methyl ester carboxylesterase
MALATSAWRESRRARAHPKLKGFDEGRNLLLARAETLRGRQAILPFGRCRRAGILQALAQLGIERCIVLGHSWGAAVAVALALRHASSVKGLVLVSRYYYPTDRFDAGLQFLQASPIIGDVLRYTLSPLLGRLGWPSLMKKLFSPATISRSFSDAIREMALRPSQLHSIAPPIRR